jgi:hypothetical protein
MVSVEPGIVRVDAGEVARFAIVPRRGPLFAAGQRWVELGDTESITARRCAATAGASRAAADGSTCSQGSPRRAGRSAGAAGAGASTSPCGPAGATDASTPARPAACLTTVSRGRASRGGRSSASSASRSAAPSSRGGGAPSAGELAHAAGRAIRMVQSRGPSSRDISSIVTPKCYRCSTSFAPEI